MEIMEETRIDKMESMLTKLQDALKTQESLISKLGKIQVDLFDLEDEDLEESVNNIDSRAKDTHDLIADSMEEFEMAINRARQEEQ